jgi:alkaline phosphatase D
MIGAVTESSARVWVRSDATRKLALRLAGSGDPSAAPVAQIRYPRADDDFATVFDLEGLMPGHAYGFSIDVDGVPSEKAKGSFVTPKLAVNHEPMRVAFGSCALGWAQPIFGAISAEKPDVFLFIGDNHYGNTSDLDSLRWFYRRSLEIPERAATVAGASTLAVWDDHDYVGNNTIGSSPGKETALRAFKEYWANLSYGTQATPGIFSTYRRGDVEFFLLDDRYYRSAESNAQGTMLGALQTAWLQAALKASTATFKLLATGSMWSAHSGETWADFPATRTAFFNFIRDEKIGGVVLLAGDVHRAELRKIHRTAAGAYDLPEIVSSPLAHGGGACPASSEPDSHTVVCLDAGNYFATLDIDTAAVDPTLTARIRDEAGAIKGTMVVKRSTLQ